MYPFPVFKPLAPEPYEGNNLSCSSIVYPRLLPTLVNSGNPGISILQPSSSVILKSK